MYLQVILWHIRLIPEDDSKVFAMTFEEDLLLFEQHQVSSNHWKEIEVFSFNLQDEMNQSPDRREAVEKGQYIWNGFSQKARLLSQMTPI